MENRPTNGDISMDIFTIFSRFFPLIFTQYIHNHIHFVSKRGGITFFANILTTGRTKRNFHAFQCNKSENNNKKKRKNEIK